METFYDVLQFLKKYGIFIYTGDKQADLELIEDEIRELHRSQLIETKDYQSAILLLRREMQMLERKNSI